MEENVVRLSKFFFIRHKSVPSFLLEVEDGAKGEGTAVAVSESEVLGHESVDYQLWYFDRVSQTVHTKLNNFCLQMNEEKLMVVGRYVAGDVKQQWVIEKDEICCQSERQLRVGVDGPLTAGARCRASDTTTSSSNCSWLFDHHSPFYMHLKPQSDPKLVLDVRGADRKSGAKVILYTDKGDLADNQLWYEDERGVVRSKMNGFAMDASGKELTVQPYDKTSPYQQWVISNGQLCSAVQPGRVLQLKPGTLFTNTSVIAVDNISLANQHLWSFHYIPHQLVSLNHPGTGKYFTICSRATGRVMQVDGEVIEAGSRVRLTEKAVSKVKGSNTVSLRQQFCRDDTTGTIRSVLRYYCIDIDQAGHLVINPFDPSAPMQQWEIGERKIQSRRDPNVVLQVRSDSRAELTRDISTGEYIGSDLQLWNISHVSASCFYIVSQWNGKVLDVRGDETSAGASLIVYDRKPVVSANQVWYEDEIGLIRSKLNGYVIDTSSGEAFIRPFEPANIKQHWVIVGDRIQNKYDSNLVLDIYGKSTLSAKVGEYTFHGGQNQLWTFEPVL